ncbi:MAG: MarR family transcriptional regulator [Phycisphaerales bacterium]|nr:MAG: MarR family transcriptional regulator [Phycisphaerales bacterium]
MEHRTLQSEIHKQHPFDTKEQEAYLSVLRTGVKLEAAVERLFKDFGLSHATYNVLRILRGSGEAGRACHEISEHMVARVPDITRLVDRLERAGFAKRARGGTDRRVVNVTITKAGLELLESLDAPVLELHEKQLGHMSRQELQTLIDLLAKARHPGT